MPKRYTALTKRKSMVLAILLFAVIIWLGLYLISRNLTSLRLRFAGLGLISYTLGWACITLTPYFPTPSLGFIMVRISWSLFALPVCFWTGTLITFLSEESVLHTRLLRIWLYSILPVVTLCFLLSISTSLLFDGTDHVPHPNFSYFIFSTIVLLPFISVLCFTWSVLRSLQPKHIRGILLVSLLSFTVSTVLFLLPQSWLPELWILLLMGLSLLVPGVTIAVIDAYEQGEALLPDIFRSFDFSFGTAFLFAGQVVLVILLGTGLTFSLLALLFTILATSIAIQIFSNQLATLLDTLAFFNLPLIQKVRAELRTTASAVPKVDHTLYRPLTRLSSPASLDVPSANSETFHV